MIYPKEQPEGDFRLENIAEYVIKLKRKIV